MWQLQLLHDVLPVFFMLAVELASELGVELASKLSVEPASKAIDGSQGSSGTRPGPNNHIFTFFLHIMNIKEAVEASRGQWKPGLDAQRVSSLVSALESRIQMRKSFVKQTCPIIQYSLISHSPTSASWTPHEARAVPTLHELRTRIARQADKRGVTASWMVRNMPSGGKKEHEQREKIRQYLNDLDVSIRLFHRGRTDPQMQESQTVFLEIIEEACQHLKEVYLEPPRAADTPLILPRNPGNGFGTLTESLVHLLRRHWNSGPQPRSAAEARLGLLSLQADTASQEEEHRPNGGGTVFEILLPACERRVDWKVVDVRITASKGSKARQINDNLYDLVRNKDVVRLNLWVDHVEQKLWTVPPLPPAEVYQNSGMESLHALLGDNEKSAPRARLWSYDAKDRLALAHILAASVLCLYPGPRIGTECCWSSEKIWFTRFAGTDRPLLTIKQPYLSADVLHRRGNPKESRHHPHRPIVALGIMLLEIAARTKFGALCGEPRGGGGSPSNEDGILALEVLRRLESGGDEALRVPIRMAEAIRACLRLGSDRSPIAEGPLRHHILSRVVAPLAAALEKEQTRPADEIRVEQAIEGQANDGAKAQLAAQWLTLYRGMLHRVYDDKESIYHRRLSDKKVKVAALDSGIELSRKQQQDYFRRRQIEYRDWVDGQDLEDTWENRKDTVGHGTHLCTLLANTAPKADIRVARVFEGWEPKSGRDIENVAQAIRHAVDVWEVDIIVMSFGWDVAPRHEVPILSAVGAIRHAANKGVGMFAAASNQGKNRLAGATWPARMDEVICVHSFDGHGNPSGFTPSPNGNRNLAVLGEGIESAWPEKLGDGPYRCLSGTSCAALIAGAMAAVILEYAHAFLSGEEWLELRRVAGLRRMVERLGNRRAGGYSYVLPWETFAATQNEVWIQQEIRIAAGL